MDRGLQNINQSNEVADDGESLVRMFLEGRNQKTVEAYRNDLVDFKTFVGVPDIKDAINLLLRNGHGNANKVVLAYRSNSIDRRLSPSTVNRRLSAIRSVISLARTLGMISWALEVKNLKAETYRDTRGPGRSNFEKMLTYISSKRSDKAIRDLAILRLLHDLGLRVSECTGIDLEDVELTNRSVKIKGKGKTQKQVMSLPEPTRVAMSAWIAIRGNELGPLFINFDRAKKGKRLTRNAVYEIVRKLGENINIRTSPHGLRHLSITEACRLAQKNGFGLEDVLDHSRHSSLEVLKIYIDRVKNVQGEIASLVANRSSSKTP